MSKITKASIVLAGCLSLLPMQAMAQGRPGENCMGLADDPTWKQTFQEFSKEYSEGNFENAEKKVLKLLSICSSSPLVNYTAGMTYSSLKDYDKARKYLWSAIKNTQYYVVEDDLYKKILLAYYKVENIDTFCEYEDYQKLKVESAAEIKALQEQVARSISSDSIRDRELAKYGSIMWTGTGIGAVGLGVTIAGAVMMAMGADDKNKCIKNNNLVSCADNETSNAKFTNVTFYSSKFGTGAILLGVGGGLLVAGAAMAGIAGYHYTHPISDDVLFSWEVSPSHLEFGMTF